MCVGVCVLGKAVNTGNDSTGTWGKVNQAMEEMVSCVKRGGASTRGEGRGQAASRQVPAGKRREDGLWRAKTREERGNRIRE